MVWTPVIVIYSNSVKLALAASSSCTWDRHYIVSHEGRWYISSWDKGPEPGVPTWIKNRTIPGTEWGQSFDLPNITYHKDLACEHRRGYWLLHTEERWKALSSRLSAEVERFEAELWAFAQTCV